MCKKIGFSMTNENDKTEKLNDHEEDPQDESSSVDADKESENGEALPGGPENQVANHWVKEIPDDSEMEDGGIVESLDNLSVNKGDLPDWINELSPADQENLSTQGGNQENEENPEEIQIDTADVSMDNEKILEEDHNEDTSVDESENLDEGFVEISEYDLETVEKPDEEPQLPEDAVEVQEELPDWLEDMISEEQKPMVEEDEEKSFDEKMLSSDEPTKPVPIIEETITDADQGEMIEEKPSGENLILDEINFEKTGSQIEDSIHIVEFDEQTDFEPQELEKDFSVKIDQGITETPNEVVPVQVIDEIQDYEEIQENDEDWEIYDQQPVEIPKTLRFAKYLLDQGKIDQANQIFQTFISKADQMEAIKLWVTEAIDEGNLSQNKLWEILGDIAVKQSDHAEALADYTRSISLLLKNQ
jgi:hypothetical protein